MKPCLKVLMVAVVVVLGGCTPRMDANTANTAKGHEKCVQTSKGLVCNYDSEDQFASCRRINTEQMGPSGADAYCRCATDKNGVVVPSQNPAIPPTCYIAGSGSMSGGGMMGGYGATTVWPSRPIVVIPPNPTPPGVIAMENAGGGALVIPDSSGAQPSTPGGASRQDVEDLARSQAALQAAICRERPHDPVCCKSCKK